MCWGCSTAEYIYVYFLRLYSRRFDSNEDDNSIKASLFIFRLLQWNPWIIHHERGNYLVLRVISNARVITCLHLTLANGYAVDCRKPLLKVVLLFSGKRVRGRGEEKLIVAFAHPEDRADKRSAHLEIRDTHLATRNVKWDYSLLGA